MEPVLQRSLRRQVLPEGYQGCQVALLHPAVLSTPRTTAGLENESVSVARSPFAPIPSCAPSGAQARLSIGASANGDGCQLVSGLAVPEQARDSARAHTQGKQCPAPVRGAPREAGEKECRAPAEQKEAAEGQKCQASGARSWVCAVGGW